MAQAKADTAAKRLLTKKDYFPERKKPYWETLVRGVALGYRKQPGTTRWLVRYKDPQSTSPKQPYAIEAFGYPDDQVNIDAKREVLDYDAAQDRAKEIAKERMAVEAAPTIDTVASVVRGYIDHRDKRPGRSGSDARNRLTKHVLPADIAAKKLRDVTISDLEEWRDATELGDSTRRRLLNDFKAALNLDWDRKRRRSMPADWAKRLKEGLAFTAGTPSDDEPALGVRENQILNDDQVRKIIDAAAEIDADVHRMVAALAVTGMRFSQLARMRLRDLRAPNILMIPVSRKGRSGVQKAMTHIRRIVSEGAFRAIYRDGKPDDFVFERNRHVQVTPTEWRVDSRGPWLSSSEITRPWAAIRQKAEIDTSIVPYALRHTAIVRMLTVSQKSPLTTAKLFDTSVEIIEKHYGAWAAYADHDEMGIEI